MFDLKISSYAHSRLFARTQVSRESFASDSAEENGLLCARLTPPSEVRRCTECAAAFADAAALNVHSLRRHISRRLTRHVACPVCGVEAEDLTAHVRKEHDVDGVVCPHCGKILSKTCTLNRHIEQVSVCTFMNDSAIDHDVQHHLTHIEFVLYVSVYSCYA